MWKNKPLGEIAILCSGGTPDKKHSEYYTNGTIPWIRSGELNQNVIFDSELKITELGLQKSSAQIFPAGTLLIAMYGASIGKIARLGIDAATNQAVCGIFENSEVSLDYLYYFLLYKKPDLIKCGIGGAQPNISQTILKKVIVSYPTDIMEQQRIVAHIEELFSQLDSGVETLKKTKQQLEVYRQAVLKEAFSCCDKMVSIESVCSHVTDGDHMPPPKSTTGIPFIMISNVENNRICWDKTAFVDEIYFNAIDAKRKPQNGDVLYTVTGSFGIPVLVDYEKDFCFQRHIALLRPKTTILQKYLYYALMEPSVFAQASAQATGTAQKTVGLGVLRKILIPYTDSIENQQRIIQKIEACLSVHDSIVQTVNETLQYAIFLKQSILKQAFEA